MADLSNKKKKFIKRNCGAMDARELAASLKIPVKDVERELRELGVVESSKAGAPGPRGMDAALSGLLLFIAAAAPLMVRRGLFNISNLPQGVFVWVGGLLMLCLILARAALHGAPLRIPRGAAPVFLAGFVAWTAVSLSWAVNVNEGLAALAPWAAGGLVFWGACNILDNEKQGARLLAALFISGAAVSLLGICQHLFDVDWVPQAVPPASTFANRNMAVHFVVLTLPLGAGFFLRARALPSVLAFAFSTTLMLNYLFYTSNRAGWICLAFQCVVGGWALWMLRRRLRGQRMWTREKTLAAAGCMILFFVLFNLTPRGFAWQFGEVFGRVKVAAVQAVHSLEAPPDAASPPEAGAKNPEEEPLAPASSPKGPKAADTSLELRVDIWKNTLAMIREHFWLGVGAGNHNVQYPIYARRAAVEKVFSEEFQLSNVHNDYLQIASETGAPGILLFGGLILAVLLDFIGAVRRTSPSNGLLLLAMGAGLAGLGLNACASFPLQRTIPVMTAALYLAVLQVHLTAEDKGRMREMRIPAGMAWASCFLAFGLLLWGGWMGWRLMEADRCYLNLTTVERCQRWDAVLREGREVLRFNPRRTRAYSFIGRAWLEKGENGKAVPVLNRVIAEYPYHMNALLNLGVAYAAGGRYEEALEIYDRVLAIKPDYAKVHNNLGNIHLSQGEVEKAVHAFGKAVSLAPGNASMWMNLGVAATRVEDFEKAADCFIKAAQLKPDWARAQRNAGMTLYHKLGRMREGAPYLIKAQELEQKEKGGSSG